MFPTFTDTIRGFYEVMLNGELPTRILSSLKVQISGYLIGIVLAVILIRGVSF